MSASIYLLILESTICLPHFIHSCRILVMSILGSILATFSATLQSIKSEAERQSTLKVDAESKLKEVETSLKNIQAKSKQLIGALQNQLEEQTNARVCCSVLLTTHPATHILILIYSSY